MTSPAQITALLQSLEASPADAVELFKQHAPSVADRVAKDAWQDGYDDGYEQGRDSHHPQAVTFSENPYERSLLVRAAQTRFLGAVDREDDQRLILLAGDGDVDDALLAEVTTSNYLGWFEWEQAGRELTHLVAGASTAPGALVTTDGRAWVEATFAQADPQNQVTVVTLVRRRL